MHRQIAGVLTGRRTKWAALAIRVVVLAVLGPLAGKFTDVQENETSSWLPESAESTQVLDEFGNFGDPDVVPAVIVYERSGGLTAADRQAVQDQMAQIAKVDHVTDGGGEGLSAYVTGPAGVSGDFADAFAGIDGTLLMAAAGVAMLLLLLTYRSPILWLLPVISAGVALVSAQGVVYLFADADLITVNAQTAGS